MSTFSSPYKDYNFLPRDKIEKHIYRMLLLMSDKFQLTKPELGDLIFYASRFNTKHPEGGRGKSKEKVFAYLCMYILNRDNRLGAISGNWGYLAEIYKLEQENKDIITFVESEVDRINETFLSYRGVQKLERCLGSE